MKAAARQSQPAPVSATWRVAVLLLTAICLAGLFSTEAADSDFWWHLRTGQFIWQTHHLPVPDPFAYTTYLGKPAYPGEDLTRYFNLTHEWLAQMGIYLVYAVSGIPGVVLARALLLAVFCGITGWLAWRRSGHFYRGVAAALAAASVAVYFTADRPALVTFLFVAVFLAILEWRRALWTLPPLMLVWANCHSGFFLGWIVLGAYLVRDWRRLAPVAAATLAASYFNPNHYRIFEVLWLYRQSHLTATLQEWSRPPLWGPPYGFDLLLYAAAGVLIWRRKQVHLSDWLLFAAFAAASLIAFRNVMLVAVLAPVLLATYLPSGRTLPRWTMQVVAAGLACGIAAGIAMGSFFQLRAAEWRYPAGAAEFLLRNHIRAPLYNTYEDGGYLIWRLWPQQRVFIDGRALNESVFRDYQRVLYSFGPAAPATPRDRDGILARYGVGAIVMNAFEYNSGALYTLALGLAAPDQDAWKLVYDDSQALVWLRNPPAGMAVLPSAQVWDHLDAECQAHLEHSPDEPMCARTLSDLYLRTNQRQRARRALALYLEHKPGPDPSAEKAYRDLLLQP